MELNKRGGQRKGAGRKPSKNPKTVITLYVERGAIYRFENEDKLKVQLYEFIANYGQNKDIGKGDVPLPADYVEIKNIAIVQPSGAIEPLSFSKPKMEVPKISQEAEYERELRAARTIDQIKNITYHLKNDIALGLKAKNRLEFLGMELSKSMYND